MIIPHRQRPTRLACSLDCDFTLRRSHHSLENSNDLLSRPKTRIQCCPRIGLRKVCSQDHAKSTGSHYCFHGLASDIILDEVDIITIKT
jgi:hypothetical protein